MRIAFEVPDTRAHFVDEIVIVRHQQHRAFVALDGDVQRVDRLEIQVVRRLVENQEVRLLQHQPAENQPRRFAAREGIGLLQALLSAEEHLSQQAANIFLASLCGSN